MKKSGSKAFWIIPVLLLAAGLVWAGWPARRPEPPKIEPAQAAWPEAETVIDCRNLALRVPAPFKLTGFSAETTGPGDNDDLHFHEYVYDSRDGARFGIEYDLHGIESYLRVTGHGWLTFHPLTFAGRPAVLAMEYGPLMHGESNLLHPRL